MYIQLQYTFDWRITMYTLIGIVQNFYSLVCHHYQNFELEPGPRNCLYELKPWKLGEEVLLIE